jgi:hypothetical protein
MYSTTRSGRVFRANELIRRARARPTSIEHLPNEAITNIFRLACDLNVDTCRLGFRLCLVSYRFRALALTCPMLWQTISIRTLGTLSLSRFRACCRASMDNPLDVIYHPQFPCLERPTHTDLLERDYRAILRAIGSQTYRLRRLTVVIGINRREYSAFECAFYNTSAPLLEFLDIRDEPYSHFNIGPDWDDPDSDPWWDWDYDDPSNIEEDLEWTEPWEIFRGGAPLLAEVKRKTLRVDRGRVPLGNLTAMSIETHETYNFPWETFGRMIEETCIKLLDVSNLTSLTLLCQPIDPDMDVDEDHWLPGSINYAALRATFNRLEHLHIDKTYRFIFAVLDAPALNSLHLSGGRARNCIHVFLDFLYHHPLPQVQKLTTDSVDLAEHYLLCLFDVLPSIAHICFLEHFTDRQEWLYSVLADDDSVWPRLNKITAIAARKQPLMELIRARASVPDARLRELELARGFYAHIEKIDPAAIEEIRTVGLRISTFRSDQDFWLNGYLHVW